MTLRRRYVEGILPLCLTKVNGISNVKRLENEASSEGILFRAL